MAETKTCRDCYQPRHGEEVMDDVILCPRHASADETIRVQDKTIRALCEAAASLLPFIWEQGFEHEQESDYERAVVRFKKALDDACTAKLASADALAKALRPFAAWAERLAAQGIAERCPNARLGVRWDSREIEAATIGDLLNARAALDRAKVT